MRPSALAVFMLMTSSNLVGCWIGRSAGLAPFIIRSTKLAAEDELRRLIGEHGFSIANLAYHLNDGGKFFDYGMVIKSRDRANANALAQHLSKLSEVLEFRIDPMGD